MNGILGLLLGEYTSTPTQCHDFRYDFLCHLRMALNRYETTRSVHCLDGTERGRTQRDDVGRVLEDYVAVQLLDSLIRSLVSMDDTS